MINKKITTMTLAERLKDPDFRRARDEEARYDAKYSELLDMLDEEEEEEEEW